MAEHIPDLLPCPFCGGEAAATRWDGEDGPNFMVACDSEVCKHSLPFDHLSDAIDVWNTRAAPETTAERDRLKGLYDEAVMALVKLTTICPDCGGRGTVYTMYESEAGRSLNSSGEDCNRCASARAIVEKHREASQ